MNLGTIDDAFLVLARNKEEERELDLPSNSFDIKYHFNEGEVIPSLFRKKTGDRLYIINPAFNQFLDSVCGSGSRSVWNYAVNSPKVIIEDQMDDACEMLQMKADRTRKTIRLHMLGNRIMGVTSQRYVKIYDIDLLQKMGQIVGDDKFVTCYHDYNVTRLEYVKGSFEGPDGLDFQMRIRITNNQWGRSSLSINPVIVRVVCSNGATVPFSGVNYTTRHVGEVNLAYMDVAINQISSKFKDLETIVRNSFNRKIKPTSMMEKIKKTFRIGDKDIRMINNYLSSEKYPDTSYAVANAVSRLANDKEEQRRMELQSIAGRIYRGL